MRATPLDENTVKLRWSVPKTNARFKGFVVEKFSSSTGKWEAVAKCNEEKATIDGLSQTESYKFRVAFELDDGIIGKFAESDFVSTSIVSPTKFSDELKGMTFALLTKMCFSHISSNHKLRSKARFGRIPSSMGSANKILQIFSGSL